MIEDNNRTQTNPEEESYNGNGDLPEPQIPETEIVLPEESTAEHIAEGDKPVGKVITEDIHSSEGETVAEESLADETPKRSKPEKKEERGKKPFITPGKVIIFILLALICWGAYSVISIFVSPDRNVQQIYLIPEDAVFIIQSDEPVKDWKRFSSSEPWTSLSQADFFREIAENAGALDSLVNNNRTLLSLVGKRDLLISVHKTGRSKWDFLAVVDLQKVSKMDMLKDQLENIMKLTGNKITVRKYKETDIIEMRDSETGDILYSAFADNHFITSYSNDLLQRSLDERTNPSIGLDKGFIEVEKTVSGKGICRVFINYAHLSQFLSIYLGQQNETLDLISQSLTFGGMYLNTSGDRIELKGNSLLREEADPYVSAFLGSGKHKMKAHEIMSARTALYANISFDNMQEFVKQLEKALEAKDKTFHDSYVSQRSKYEKMFDISLDKDFISWMDGEIAFSQSEPGLLGREPEMILAIKTKSIKDARKKLDGVEKKIRGRTPVKIKSVDYKGYDIKYIELKGFFRLFFGKLFDRFEKPYYTYVGDYVVFSNQSSTLLSFVEDYEQKNLLKNDPVFKSSLSHASSNSTVFVYGDLIRFFPQLQSILTPAAWNDIRKNREVAEKFPGLVMQITSDNRKISLLMVADHDDSAITEAEALADEFTDEDDEIMDEDAMTEKELMNELKRFYVEKFEGNVLRDYYEDGTLLSESEVKKGVRHGRYREFYKSGKLKLRGKYNRNKPKGTWKYYTEEGKFDRKEKY